MYKDLRVATIVPAYNESLLIAKTIMTMPDFIDHIIVVDDCSTDDTTDKAVATVTDTHDELLFAGAMPVERINEASESGVVVGFVPSAVKADGTLALDLASTPIYWAKPEILPEALTAADVQATFEAAVSAGVVAQRSDVVQRAQQTNDGPVYMQTEGMLYRYAADVIERYSPEEADLISGLRAPLVIK